MNHTETNLIGVLGLYCLLVFLASLAGGWLLLLLKLSHARLQILVSLVAGLMLGMALLHFIPHAFHQNHSVDQTLQLALAGFLIMFLLQRFFPHHHHDVPDEAPESSASPAAGSTEPRHHPECVHREHTLAEQSARQLSWVATTIGMAFHSLLGGAALAAAAASQGEGHTGLVGLGTAAVMILHKPFDALAVSVLMTASGCARFVRNAINLVFAAITPLGALGFFLGLRHMASAHPAIQGSALAFCAGTFLCISCSDLLPELQFHSHDRLKLSLAMLAGLAIAFGIGALESSVHHQ
jgi:zinc and cadmium transporter